MSDLESRFLEHVSRACADLRALAAQVTYSHPTAVSLITSVFGAADQFPQVTSPLEWRGPALPTRLPSGAVESAFFGPSGSASCLTLHCDTSTSIGQVLIAHAQLHASCDNEYTAAQGDVSLSARERAVLSYVARGYSSKEIAKLLDISPRTVEYFVESAREKLGARNRPEAILRGVLTRQIDLTEFQ